MTLQGKQQLTGCLCVQGEHPSVQSALEVYHMLTEGDSDLRQPVGLETQLLKESSMDSEVGMSMLQLLSVQNSDYQPLQHGSCCQM